MNERIEKIRLYYSQPKESIEFFELSLEVKVFIGAICRAMLRENLYEIAPTAESCRVLAPTKVLQEEIYYTLLKKNVIVVSPTSPLVSFQLDADDFPEKFDIHRVKYNLNIKFPENKQKFFEDLFNSSYYCPDNAEEALVLWKKIALAECVEYLSHRLSKVGFDFSPADKTYATFATLLRDFSVGQIYGIIWKSVAASTKLYMEKAVSKKHAANSVIGACERYAERAKCGHWDLSNFHRERDLPQSELSSYFFNRVVEIGAIGFEKAPNIEWLLKQI